MGNNSRGNKNYPSVSIYRDFYFNNSLVLLTVTREYPNLEAVFIENQYLQDVNMEISTYDLPGASKLQNSAHFPEHHPPMKSIYETNVLLC